MGLNWVPTFTWGISEQKGVGGLGVIIGIKVEGLEFTVGVLGDVSKWKDPRKRGVYRHFKYKGMVEDPYLRYYTFT